MNLNDLRGGIQPAPVVKIMFNIGAGLDIPTGTYLEGRHGEHVLNGGLSTLTGVVGQGNMFKSTVMHYMMLTGMSRVDGSVGDTYDTECNIQEWHLKSQAIRIEGFNGESVIDTGRWKITDKTIYSGNEWYVKQKEFLENKRKNATKFLVETPFWNRERNGPFMMMMPSFTEVDSFSEFETDDVIDIQNKNELGESGANTMHMRQGLAKMRFLMEAPRLNCGTYNYLLMTAHIGKETTMQNAGPAGQVPITKLKHLKNGDKIKGVTDKFTFMTHNCWHCYDAKPLMAADGMGPLYPRDSSDKVKYDTDLNVVSLRNLRSKSGISGMTQLILVSQDEGVLPSLTEFHHIKENKYGLEGNDRTYALSLHPDVSLSRTTVRGKIDSDPILRRALNITCEMLQMETLWHDLPEGLLCTPKELYDDLIKLGYDWKILMETRGWWTINNEKHPIPFLSTMDMLRMRKGLYHPYWYPVKKEELKVAG